MKLKLLVLIMLCLSICLSGCSSFITISSNEDYIIVTDGKDYYFETDMFQGVFFDVPPDLSSYTMEYENVDAMSEAILKDLSTKDIEWMYMFRMDPLREDDRIKIVDPVNVYEPICPEGWSASKRVVWKSNSYAFEITNGAHVAIFSICTREKYEYEQQQTSDLYSVLTKEIKEGNTEYLQMEQYDGNTLLSTIIFGKQKDAYFIVKLNDLVITQDELIQFGLRNRVP